MQESLNCQGSWLCQKSSIYADLMATADPRNLEAAKEVYGRFLETLVDQY